MLGLPLEFPGKTDVGGAKYVSSPVALSPKLDQSEDERSFIAKTRSGQ
eukprot:COSAG06_NODE_25610_length_632_cov_5.108818_2_plen_47_part_01